MKLIQIITSITLCIALLAQYNTFALQSNDLTNHMNSSDRIVVSTETEHPQYDNSKEQKSTSFVQFKQFIAKPAVKYTTIILTASLILYTGAVYTDYASSPMALWNPTSVPQKSTSTTTFAHTNSQINSQLRKQLLQELEQYQNQLEQTQQKYKQDQVQNILSLQTCVSTAEQQLQTLKNTEKRLSQEIQNLKNKQEINDFLRVNQFKDEREINNYFSTQLTRIKLVDMAKIELLIALFGNLVEYKNEIVECNKKINNMYATINTLEIATKKLSSQFKEKQNALTIITTIEEPIPDMLKIETYADQLNVLEQNKQAGINDLQKTLTLLQKTYKKRLSRPSGTKEKIDLEYQEKIQKKIAQIIQLYSKK